MNSHGQPTAIIMQSFTFLSQYETDKTRAEQQGAQYKLTRGSSETPRLSAWGLVFLSFSCQQYIYLLKPHGHSPSHTPWSLPGVGSWPGPVENRLKNHRKPSFFMLKKGVTRSERQNAYVPDSCDTMVRVSSGLVFYQS